MGSLAQFVRDYFQKLEEREAERLDYGSGFSVERHLENTAKLERERLECYTKATRREIERRGLTVPRFYQPFDGAAILRDGEPWHSRYWCAGTFYSDEGAWSRAWRIELERCHADAIREDAFYLRHAVRMAHSEALIEERERSILRRALVASVQVARPAYQVTPEGHNALVEA